MSSLTFYIDTLEVADEIYNDEAFNEVINKLAENSDYDYIDQSKDELTDEGKAFIKKLAKQIENMENDNAKD